MTLKRWVIGILAGSMILVGCAPQTPKTDTLPTGDATNGAVLFAESINGVPACTTCHTLDGSVVVGPSLQGYAKVAATRTDLAAEVYTLQSITQPAVHIVEGFPNAMYGQYGQKLSQQQLADLIAYLMTLS